MNKLKIFHKQMKISFNIILPVCKNSTLLRLRVNGEFPDQICRIGGDVYKHCMSSSEHQSFSYITRKSFKNKLFGYEFMAGSLF